MKNSEIPSIGNDQEYQAIKIKSLSAMNKAGTYDDTLAYFVAGIKYKGQWYTENLATINNRKIGPGTIIIDTKSKMDHLRKIAVREGWDRSIWRHLLADHLGLDTDLPDIERIGFAENMLIISVETHLNFLQTFHHTIKQWNVRKEFANNRYSLHNSRKPQKPKKSVQDIYFHCYCNRSGETNRFLSGFWVVNFAHLKPNRFLVKSVLKPKKRFWHSVIVRYQNFLFSSTDSNFSRIQIKYYRMEDLVRQGQLRFSLPRSRKGGFFSKFRSSSKKYS